ncbi:hypothetical protein ACO0LF_27260 [Undibacterium sp. Di27W]|uniref:hypothetical protein n=1 Tax=Undibacterium sp. Di27W TaxID=3413036 RepID=UPI003BF3ED7E
MRALIFCCSFFIMASILLQPELLSEQPASARMDTQVVCKTELIKCMQAGLRQGPRLLRSYLSMGHGKP